MKTKKIFLMALVLIAILSLSAVSAAENTTEEIDNSQVSLTEPTEDILIDNNTEKQDLNVEIDYSEHFIKPDYSERTFDVQFDNVPRDYKSDVNIYLDGTYLSDMDPHTYMRVPVYDLSYGDHILKANFPETSKYNALNITHKFEVAKQYIEIPKEAIVDNGRVHLELQRGATGYLIVKVNGKEFQKVSVKTEDGGNAVASVILKNLAVGTYEIEATYTGDKNNQKMTKHQTVNITNKIKMHIFNPTFLYRDFPSNAYKSGMNKLEIMFYNIKVNALPTVSAYGTKLKVVREDDGRFYADLDPLTIGTHKVTVELLGDDVYTSPAQTIEVEVIGSIYTHISEFNNSYSYLKLPDDAKGKLNAYINGTLFKSEKVSNGIANISFADALKVGENYEIYMNYSEDDYKIQPCSEVKTIIPKVTYPKSINYGETATFLVEMDSEKNGNLIFEVSQDKVYQTHNITLINGKANITLKNLRLIKNLDDEFGNLGNAISMKFVGENYNYSYSYNVVVQPIPSKFTNSKDITMYYGDSRTFSIKVWGDDGKVAANQKVTIKIGTKEYPVNTDKNGIAKLKINQIPGNYKITVTYQKFATSWGVRVGDIDVDYSPITKTHKLIVKQPLSLKAVTVKKSAKKLTLQATLKNKKAIKGKTITFKFNGKTFKAKTNSKGIAKVTIKSTILKKLKVGKKITYQATYGKDTIKKTAKVKK